MSVTALPTPPAPTLRQILTFMGVEHGGLRARRSYLGRVARECAANDDQQVNIEGLEVTYLDAEQWVLAVTSVAPNGAMGEQGRRNP